MSSDQARIWRTLSESTQPYYLAADEAEREVMRNWVRGVLSDGTVTVTFTKVNGETRVMRCTLSESLMPPTLNTSDQRKVNTDVCAVWDLDAQAWRSFRWDTVKRIEFTLG